MPDHLASGSTVAITPRPSLNSRPFHTTFILRRDLQHIANFFRGVRRQRQYIRGAVAVPAPPPNPAWQEHTHFGRNVASTLHQRGNSVVTNSCSDLFLTRAGL